MDCPVGPDNAIRAGLLRGEFARADGVDARPFERVIRPRQAALARLIGAMFPNLGERERRIAAFNVASQCIFLRIGHSVVLRLFDREEFDEEFVAAIAERIVATSLLGLGASTEGSA